jgi:hypothetical protein
MPHRWPVLLLLLLVARLHSRDDDGTAVHIAVTVVGAENGDAVELTMTPLVDPTVRCAFFGRNLHSRGCHSSSGVHSSYRLAL